MKADPTPVISVSHLSKQFRLGSTRPTGDGLRHEVHRMLTTPVSWLRQKGHALRNPPPDFWALRDVNFEIQPGEVVGVIGRNGAGKSTLLKLLSRITPPTTGEARIRGRLASMLEVGTGFHPELTGRENVFLNGAILGMSRAEIRTRFDEIIDFAGVEQFLDTPVKRYSSGMYVRLAFAVAAHLEPDILIIDEVLAVGDADFQQKCLGKMDQASRCEGRTVLVVSHQMPVIRNLCHRCLYLEGGRLVADGPTDEMVSLYENHSVERTRDPLLTRLDRGGSGLVRATRVFSQDVTGRECPILTSGEPATLAIDFEVHSTSPVRDCVFCVEICKNLKKYFSLSTALVDRKRIDLCHSGTLRFHLPKWPLMSGHYQVNLYIGSAGQMLDHLDDAASLDVRDGDFYGTGRVCHEGWHGVSVMVDHSWDLSPAARPVHSQPARSCVTA